MSKSTASTSNKDKAKTVTVPTLEITLNERYRMIAEAAYYHAEKRGFLVDDMAADWLAAEADIDRMLGQEGIVVIDGSIEGRVRSTLANDPANIADQVRSITLRALSEGEMDKEAIGRVSTAVVAGAKEFTAGAAEGATALREAIRGLDEALASAAEATHLALQEAAGRGNEFSRQAIQKSLDDLDALESMFIETLTEGAKDATGFAQATLSDLAEHARVGGTAVGQKVEPALKQLAHVFTNTLHEQADIGAEALHKQYALLAGIANGIIKGVVEHLHTADAGGKPSSAKGRR